jgi:hypothetical protein
MKGSCRISAPLMDMRFGWVKIEGPRWYCIFRSIPSIYCSKYRIVKHVLSWHLPHILDKASRFSEAQKGSHSWLKMSGSLPTAETKRVSSTASQPVAAAGHNAHRPPMMKYRPVRLQVVFCYSIWLFFFLGGNSEFIIINHCQPNKKQRHLLICEALKSPAKNLSLLEYLAGHWMLFLTNGLINNTHIISYCI